MGLAHISSNIEDIHLTRLILGVEKKFVGIYVFEHDIVIARETRHASIVKKTNENKMLYILLFLAPKRTGYKAKGSTI